MRKFLIGMSFAAMLTTGAIVTAPPSFAADTKSLVEFDMMTWPEVKAAIAAGKTTALYYTGGTEQRGPQNVTGGHTLMGRVIVKRIAEKLGNAIAMPMLAYTPDEAMPDLPGSIGLTDEILAPVLERLSEQAIKLGFKNVVLLADHGGGQFKPNVYRDVATKLDAKHAAQGIHVYYCDDLYFKTQKDFAKYMMDNGYGMDSHAGVQETSTMLYLGGNEGWVRKDLIATAVGDPVPPDGSMVTGTPLAKINNGITGDARKSNVDLGKHYVDMKVDIAVKQIQSFIKPKG